MYEPNNMYEILKAVYDDNGAINAYEPSSAQEYLKSVFEPDGTGKGKLRISGAGGGSSDLNGLTDVTLVSVTNGQLLGFNGTKWVNVDPGAASAFPLSNLTDTTITNIQIKQIIQWNGTAWVNIDLPSTDLTNYYNKTEVNTNFLSANTDLVEEISDLSNVVLVGVQDKDVLSFDTATGHWVNKVLTTDLTNYYNKTESNANFLSANTVIPTDFYTQNEANTNFLSANTTLVSNLTDLGDVILTTPSNNQILKFNGTNWVNGDASGGVSEVENGLTIVNNKIHFGGSLSANTKLYISDKDYTIESLKTITTYSSTAVSTIISDGDTSTITGTDTVNNYSVGIQDTDNDDLSYLDIDLENGVTISSNTVGSTSYIKIKSEFIELNNDGGTGTKILMTATDGTAQFYLTVDNTGNLTTTAV